MPKEFNCAGGPMKKPIKRWALYSQIFGFYRPLPHQTEILYDSRRMAVAARLSGSYYNYQPVKVELHMAMKVKS